VCLRWVSQQLLTTDAKVEKRAKDPLPWEGVQPAYYYLKNRKERIQVLDQPRCSCCRAEGGKIVVPYAKVQVLSSSLFHSHTSSMQASLLQKPKEAVHSMLKVQSCQELPQTIDEVLNRAPRKKAGRLKSGPSAK
jgi:hypothetical protein